MKVTKNVPLPQLTTMRLGGNADYLITIEEDKDLPEAYRFARSQKLPVYILGSGSNVIGRDKGFRGVVLKSALRGISIYGTNKDGARITARSGELFDDLVAYSVEMWNGEDYGYSGIEAMSAIPGTVGAAPVQNIGAYGQEMQDTMYLVTVYDTQKDLFLTLTRKDMKLGYRRSIFNYGKDVGRYFVTAMTVDLRKTWLKGPFYTSLQKYILEHQIKQFSPKNIRDAVCTIRASKLPDPQKIASSGSFFKNLYLSEAEAAAAKKRGIEVWPGGVVNTGWLIEQAGLKGKLISGMRVSDQSALVLINESAKTYADLAKARQTIVDAVFAKFQLKITQEPMELGEN